MFKTAALFIARLTEVEKSFIRGAINEDRLDWLFHARHAREVASRKIFDEAKIELDRQYHENSKSDLFGRTWAF